jgi:hypothetical protein
MAVLIHASRLPPGQLLQQTPWQGSLPPQLCSDAVQFKACLELLRRMACCIAGVLLYSLVAKQCGAVHVWAVREALHATEIRSCNKVDYMLSA